MCTLWQRFGQGARDPALTAIALFLVEPGYFDDIRELQVVIKALRIQKFKQKAMNGRNSKKQKLVYAIATSIVLNSVPNHMAALAKLDHDNNAELPSITTVDNVPIASHPILNTLMRRSLPSWNPPELANKPATVIKNSTAYKSNDSGSKDNNNNNNNNNNNPDAEQVPQVGSHCF
jgi:hypothetical protein